MSKLHLFKKTDLGWKRKKKTQNNRRIKELRILQGQRRNIHQQSSFILKRTQKQEGVSAPLFENKPESLPKSWFLTDNNTDK